MLVFKSRYRRGEGLFDIIKNVAAKTAQSQLAKKIINSATKENLSALANSSLGKQAQQAVFSGLERATQNTAEGALNKLGIKPRRRGQAPPTSRPKKRRRKKKKITGRGIIRD